MEDTILKIVGLFVIIFSSGYIGYVWGDERCRYEKLKKNSGPQATIEHLDNIVDDLMSIPCNGNAVAFISLMNAIESILNAMEHIEKAIE